MQQPTADGKKRRAAAESAAPPTLMTMQEVADYLRVNIRYELGAEEHRAADLFLGRAHEIGLIGPPRPILWTRGDARPGAAAPGVA